MGYQIKTLSAKQQISGKYHIPKDLEHPDINRIYITSPDWFKNLGKITRLLTRLRPKKIYPQTTIAHQDNYVPIDSTNPVTLKIKKFVLKFCLPDEHFLWIWLTLIKWVFYYQFKIKFDIVYVTVPPVTPIFAGYFISLFCRKKLYIDYRDSWVGNELYSHKTRLQNMIEKYFEKIILKHAVGIIVTTPAMKKDLKNRYSNLPPIEIITNGYDESDYEGIDYEANNADNFIIGYFGAIDLGRDPTGLFKAISELKKEGFDETNKVRISFTGHFPFMGLAKQWNIDHLIIHNPPVTQRESIIQMAQCSILLIIIKKEQGAQTAIPGKSFEYLRTGKPILALADDGALREQFQNNQQFHFCYPDNVSEIKITIKYLFDLWSNKSLPTYSEENFKLYNRLNLAKQLHQFLQNQNIY